MAGRFASPVATPGPGRRTRIHLTPGGPDERPYRNRNTWPPFGEDYGPLLTGVRPVLEEYELEDLKR